MNPLMLILINMKYISQNISRNQIFCCNKYDLERILILLLENHSS